MKRIISILFITLVTISLFSCFPFENSINWFSLKLKDKIPDPVFRTGEVLENSETKLSIIIYNFPSKEYPTYVDKCINNYGYIYDIDSRSYYYSALNASGDKIIIIYNSDSNEINIILECSKTDLSEAPDHSQEDFPDNDFVSNDEHPSKDDEQESNEQEIDNPQEETKPSAPAVPSQELVWIPTNGGTKYHSRANCSNMINPKQVTKDEAIAMGFSPCKRCH